MRVETKTTTTTSIVLRFREPLLDAIAPFVTEDGSR